MLEGSGCVALPPIREVAATASPGDAAGQVCVHSDTEKRLLNVDYPDRDAYEPWGFVSGGGMVRVGHGRGNKKGIRQGCSSTVGGAGGHQS